MNYRMIAYLLGCIMVLIGGFLLLPILVALIYGEGDVFCLLQTALASAGVGGLLLLLKPKEKRTMHARDGFVMVALAWIVLSLVGAIPFWLSKAIPSYLDAVFETVSGFTTTGSSILTDVEALPHGLLFWRSFTHWLGGMGVLVFMLAIVPLSGESIFLLKAESPGPSVSKMVPKMRTSALILYAIYLAMTLLQILAYQLSNVFGWGEIPLFDSICLAFGSAGTGGFSVRNTGLNDYSNYIQTVTTAGMILFGVNFSIYFFLITKKLRLIWHNSELKAYFGIIIAAITLITLNVVSVGGLFDSVGDAIHHVSFSVGSLITTTGYGTKDFSQWPVFSRCILIFLMICGASAGSTGGGFKVSRILILVKSARMELRRLIHPHNVEVLRMDGKRLSRDVVSGTSGFLVFYLLIAIVGVMIVSLDKAVANSFETVLSAVLATMNNIGPGTTQLIGPAGSFATFSPISKIVLILNMLLGRLELFPLIIFLRPSTWRKH